MSISTESTFGRIEKRDRDARAADPNAATSKPARLDYLDATRAFALLLGLVFHTSLSFMPIFFGWAVQDISTTSLAPIFVSVSHSFRMETFFLIAGFFSHMSYHGRGVRNFIEARFLRIVVPFIAGWFILRPLILSGWFMGGESVHGHYRFFANIMEGFKSVAHLHSGIFTQTHLWFLYYLILITALVLVTRTVLNASPVALHWFRARCDLLVRWIARSPFGLLACILPTIGLLGLMRIWGVDTPDTTLRPQIPVLLLYTEFFALGWLFHRQSDLIAQFGRLSGLRWLTAGVSLACTIYLLGYQMDPGDPHFQAAHLAFVFTYAVMMWSFVALVIGVFHRLCRRPRVWIRYLADSSYWIYLIHLPLVVWLQVAVADYAINWSVKLIFIVITTLAIALLSYDLCVRSTWIGLLLNGKRQTRLLKFAR